MVIREKYISIEGIMKKNLRLVIFLSGIIIFVLSIILTFFINIEIGIVSEVLMSLGCFLLLVGSCVPDKKN
jgi:uncharacterized membrane protein